MGRGNPARLWRDRGYQQIWSRSQRGGETLAELSRGRGNPVERKKDRGVPIMKVVRNGLLSCEPVAGKRRRFFMGGMRMYN